MSYYKCWLCEHWAMTLDLAPCKNCVELSLFEVRQKQMFEPERLKNESK